jgi:hypothetical protein
MSKNNFMEPEPFSIDESVLENTLMQIGSGNKKNLQNSYDKEIKKTSSIVKKSQIENAINDLPEVYRKQCEQYVISQISKFKRNIVCNNTKEISKKSCQIGKNSGEIIYKQSTIQGDWKGLEVIIEGEGNELMVVRANGEDWEDVTGLFKIS